MTGDQAASQRAAKNLAALGDSLGAVLRDATEGRLDHIEWFRTTWQHGGAHTGFAQWNGSHGATAEVMVKVPVNETEYRWTRNLGWCDEGIWDTPELAMLPTPRVLCCGETLAGREAPWLVMERFPRGANAAHPAEPDFIELLRVTIEFYRRAAGVQPAGGSGQRQDWSDLLHRTRDAVKTHGLPEAQRWNEALKKGQRLCTRLQAAWDARPIDTWCHGDLHLGNAMRRDVASGFRPMASHMETEESGAAKTAGKGDATVLIDLAMVHAGHWVEDAVYLEHLYWARPDHLCGVKPVSVMARLRREAGLPAAGDYATLANLRRFLLAATTPLSAAHEGHLRPSHAALEVLERLLPQVGH